MKWRINADGRFEAYGPGWNLTYNTGIAFDGEHRYIVPQTSDLWIDMNACRTTADGEVWAPNWKNERLKPGTRVALRSYHRPAPAFAVNETEGLDIRNVTVVRMEVPCCGGLAQAAITALKSSGKFIPWQIVTISTDGKELS